MSTSSLIAHASLQIQELEAEVQLLEKEKQQMLQQLDTKDAQISYLQKELSTLKNMKGEETLNLAKTAHQLKEQQSQQLIRMGLRAQVQEPAVSRTLHKSATGTHFRMCRKASGPVW